MMEQLFVTAYLSLAFVSIYVIFRTLYRAYATPLRDVPGPWLAKFTRLWLVRAISTREYQKINIQLHRRYGPIVRIAPNEYSIDDPEAAQIIFRTKDQLIKAPRYEAFGLPSQESDMFSTRDNEHNARRRRQVLPLYQIGPLKNIEWQVDNTTTTFVDKLADFAREGKVVDMAEWVQYYTFDAIGALTFGKPFGFLKEGRDIADMISIIHNIVRYAAAVGVYSEWHPLIMRILQSLSSQGQAGKDYLYKFVADAVADWNQGSEEDKSLQEQKSEGGALLETDYMGSLLAKARRTPESFKVEDAYYHLVAQIGAGGETTGNEMCAAVYFLCKYPRVLEKLREEVEGVKMRSKGVWITAKEAHECSYLQAVIKETLRLFPALGINLTKLVPKGGLTLASRHFPEGTIVGINIWVAHANQSVFGPDADTFRPERWLESPEKSSKMEQYFLTFGKGPRTCIGKNIALMELGKLIAELVLRFDINLADASHEWTVRNDWFVKPEDFRVRVRDRRAGG